MAKSKKPSRVRMARSDDEDYLREQGFSTTALAGVTPRALAALANALRAQLASIGIGEKNQILDVIDIALANPPPGGPHDPSSLGTAIVVAVPECDGELAKRALAAIAGAVSGYRGG